MAARSRIAFFPSAPSISDKRLKLDRHSLGSSINPVSRGKGVKTVKYIVNEKVVLSGPPEGPLAAYIGSFTDWVNEQGFASSSLWHRVHLAACFSAWLGNQGIRLGNISSDHPAQYLRYRARRVRPQGADRAALKHLIEFLCGQGVIPPQKALPARELIPVERCAQAFRTILARRARSGNCNHHLLRTVHPFF